MCFNVIVGNRMLSHKRGLRTELRIRRYDQKLGRAAETARGVPRGSAPSGVSRGSAPEENLYFGITKVEKPSAESGPGVKTKEKWLT